MFVPRVVVRGCTACMHAWLDVSGWMDVYVGDESVMAGERKK
jgi:hypothetical protein